ncbi:MAG: PKD domain-containing protein, partial [Flavisolibacter sp.]
MRSVKSFGLHYLVLLLVFFIHSFSVQGQYVQTPRPNVPINADCNGYLETLPQEYATSNQSYPLLVFLEGIQEAGSGSFDDLQKLYNNGPPYLIKNGLFPSTFSVNAQTFRFIIITPQFSIPLWQRYPSPAEINGIIDYMVQHYRVDQSRIYLTGLSTGGGSVFYYAGASSTYANRLAAIVPFASTYGTSDSTEFTRAAVEPRARTMAAANLPVWAFHNKYDSGVPDSITINYVNYMNEAPAPNPPARATIFDASGHECWYNAYNSAYTENNLTIYQWMLQYSRGSSPPPVNKPPVVNAGANQTITLPTSSVTLSGSASDPDGTIAAYQWTKVSGGNVSFGSPAAVSTTVSGLAQGSYIFRLTATDNSGDSAYADVSVTVNGAANQPPVVNAGANQTITLPTSSVTLSGSASDPDGTIAAYQWTKVSGGNVSFGSPAAVSTTASGLAQGSYIFRLTATDNSGASAYADV